tara:strand:+ start:309 stop:845 length:537 start_codon:yes stop_codon:yes gene_type:complete
MVKNQTGGNKAKRQGRKFTAPTNSKFRVALEDGEIYAIVTKHFGNAMIEVLGIDNVYRLCVIRNKFRGRGKRDNSVSVGTWVLIGEREWEKDNLEKKPKCDLLEVYSLSDVELLKKTPNNWHILTAAAVDTEKSDMHNDAVNFVDSDTLDYINQELDLSASTNLNPVEEEDEIDFDDI